MNDRSAKASYGGATGAYGSAYKGSAQVPEFYGYGSVRTWINSPREIVSPYDARMQASAALRSSFVSPPMSAACRPAYSPLPSPEIFLPQQKQDKKSG